MRNAYLTKSHYAGGCRGGVGSDNGTYELEIASDKNASPKMLALCAHVDEIMALLESSTCPLAQMVYNSIKQETKRLAETAMVSSTES